MRHADAGYEIAIDCAKEKGVTSGRNWQTIPLGDG
jgi:urocanate hydratase